MRIFGMALLSFLFSLFLVGCQGDNSDPVVTDATTTPVISSSTGGLPKVVLPLKSAELTSNSQTVNIEVKVFDDANNPYTTGDVKIIYPNAVQTGRDVGYFASSSVALDSAGIANFSYTGPADLSANTDPISFTFYHEKNPTQGETFTFTIKPETNQVVLTDYALYGSPESVVMGLEETQGLSYTVKDKNGNVVADSDMVSMRVTLLNSTLGTLLDNNGNASASLSFSNLNNVSLNLRTNTISGLLPIKVTAEFHDANGDLQQLERIFNVTVLSGPPTAISLSYAGTSQDETNAKFIESWVLTVTDRYGNKVNTNPSVAMGMMAGYAQSSAAPSNVANYLYYDPTLPNGATGTISTSAFTATNAPFANVDDINEYLVTFGEGYTYDASGKWTIRTNSANVLDLVDDFNGSSVSNLGFAVGHNYRADSCNFGEEHVGFVYPQNGSNVVGDTGSLLISVAYDYYLVGKDVMLWVNLVGESNGENVKIGEARKITLRGMGLTGETYAYQKGFSGIVRLYIHIDKTVEYYRNARFFYSVSVSGEGTQWDHNVTTSMDRGITSCEDGGMAYVDVNITSAPENGGTITVSKVVPINEF